MIFNFNKSWHLYKTKYIELESKVEKESVAMFDFHLSFTRKQDHAGFQVNLELFELIFLWFSIYDNRHWNYERNDWQVYDN